MISDLFGCIAEKFLFLGGVPDLEKINTLAVPNEPSAYEGCVREFIVNGINYQLSEEGEFPTGDMTSK